MSTMPSTSIMFRNLTKFHKTQTWIHGSCVNEEMDPLLDWLAYKNVDQALWVVIKSGDLFGELTRSLKWYQLGVGNWVSCMGFSCLGCLINRCSMGHIASSVELFLNELVVFGCCIFTELLQGWYRVLHSAFSLFSYFHFIPGLCICENKRYSTDKLLSKMYTKVASFITSCYQLWDSVQGFTLHLVVKAPWGLCCGIFTDLLWFWWPWPFGLLPGIS